MLDLSTLHMPSTSPDFGTFRTVTQGTPEDPEAYGFSLWVTEEPEEGEPEWMGPLLKRARANECTLVLFDRDASIIEGLPTWEW